MIIDLHTHTYHSDGSLSPKELINLGLERKVKFLALTDHDIVSGIPEALEYSKGKPLILIPGIEISAKVKCSKDEVHLVGLYIDHQSPGLVDLTHKVNEFKKVKLVKKLEAVNKHFNANITYEEVQKKTKGYPGTPHIGMAILDRRLKPNIKDSIRVMSKGGPCYVKIDELETPANEAINIIHEAGGIAILAHLAAYKNLNKFVSFKEQEDLVKELKSYGLDGIEVYIPDISKEDKEFALRMANKYSLKISGGSDFHDEKFIPQNRLGYLDVQKKSLTVLR